MEKYNVLLVKVLTTPIISSETLKDRFRFRI